MTNKKATRRALFMSIISLILCCSMLVGTTLAWFTDEVNSGTNVITAGNLDVELYHGKTTAPVDKVDENTMLFTDVDGEEIKLWEPGVVAYTNLQVVNEGTLALKYDLSINAFAENATAEGGHKLSDVLQVAVVKDGVKGTTREEVLAEAQASNTTINLHNFKLSGQLDPENDIQGDNTSEVYGVVVFWNPNDNAVDNRYNMNNGKTTTDGQPLRIKLGMTLFATQQMQEKDSFGPDYDELASVGVNTVEDMLAALTEGKEAVLTCDLVLTQDAVVPAGVTSALNLNGYTLTATEGLIAVKGNLSVTNGTVSATGENVQAFMVTNTGTLDIEPGAVVNAAESAIGVYMAGGNLNVDGAVNANGFNTYGVFLYGNESSVYNVNVTGTVTAGEADGSYAISQMYGTSNVVAAENALVGPSMVSTGTMNLTYCGENKPVVMSENLAGSVVNYIKGISTASDLAALGGTKINGTYVLMADIDMTNTEMKPMEISGGANVTFIGNNYSISNLSLGAAGIHGMTGTGNEVAGLFDLTAPATTVSLTVSNLTVRNAVVSCSGYSAAIVGYNPNSGTTVTLNNVDVEGATVTAESVAALVGYTTGPVTLIDCDVSGLTLTGEEGRPEKVGAYIGTANTSTCAVSITNCSNSTAYNDCGRVINGAALTVDGVAWKTAGSQDELNAALSSGNNVEVTLTAGTTVTVNSGAAASKNVTFTGDKTSTVTLVNEAPGYEGSLSYQDNANLTFEGITFDASNISGICARGGEVKFIDCMIKGDLEKTIASKFTFYGCTFDTGVTQVGYGCSDVTFENCKFETDGYGLKIYSEGQTPINLNIKGCSFKNTGSAAKSAIFLDHIIDGITYNITVEGCTFEGFTATPTPNENKWAERMIVTDSFVKTTDGQHIFAYQTGAEDGNYHKILTDAQLTVTVN